MNTKTIQKYQGKSISWLLKRASKNFNRFIRERDKDNGCISCGSKFQHAGHFYSAGHHPGLRFNENNVHGQCLRCNNFLHGNLNEYRKNLYKKIGNDKIEDLDNIADYFKRNGFKWDRFFLIEVIEKYKETFMSGSGFCK